MILWLHCPSSLPPRRREGDRDRDERGRQAAHRPLRGAASLDEITGSPEAAVLVAHHPEELGSGRLVREPRVVAEDDVVAFGESGNADEVVAEGRGPEPPRLEAAKRSAQAADFRGPVRPGDLLLEERRRLVPALLVLPFVDQGEPLPGGMPRPGDGLVPLALARGCGGGGEQSRQRETHGGHGGDGRLHPDPPCRCHRCSLYPAHPPWRNAILLHSKDAAAHGGSRRPRRYPPGPLARLRGPAGRPTGGGAGRSG